jgi:glutamate dehydrogenase
VKYLRQARYPHAQSFIQSALTTHAGITKSLVKLFMAYLDPAQEDAEKAQNKHAKAILKALESVDSLNEDRIIRSLKSLIKNTLRTNFFQTDEDGNPKPYLSIKLDSKAINDLPKPRPFREIFVYSPRVEAVHLRGDKIARGGLRWSDRHEDFRTEVLGLMKAQMVKNSVIVPMGSKGGFVVKTPGLNREEFKAEGVECYKTFISGLLDITDNLNGTKVIPPKNTVRRDGDDPYLVVAADKGTATFSDIANNLSIKYGFWLGDAFASGGSAGYDHKKMGITARGAWESVKLHFRQLGHNTQAEPFDVVGCGDMGGDVFGNGMLLSEHIRLIGAFNHLHIFCDPNPDPKTTYAERQRLFKNICGWDEYDQSKLSKGGKIYSRADKVLKLTPEIRERFDIEEKEVAPQQLIQAMLKSRTDLLWFGGIGTYIKSKEESHADVGDKGNDALRVNAYELRAKVIGEGANLAITQLGRIEFGQRGGNTNTDFIDNSGGVDSSDHEVNIKILLSAVMKDKKHNMDIKSRNILLEKMTDDVANHVLRHNYQQAQAVSLVEMQAADNIRIHDEFIQDLEREEGVSRELEYLPDAEEIEKRIQAGHGLTRPEICVLISYAKIAFTKDLLESNIPDDPEMESWLVTYFPEILQKKYKPEILQHRLGREIIATIMANSLINRMGPTFIKSTMKKTGMSCADIFKAYIIVRDIFQLRPLWDQIEALDNKVPAEVQLRAMLEISKLAEFAIIWFLTRYGRDLDLCKNISDFQSHIDEISKNIDKLVSGNLKNLIEMRTNTHENDGLPKALSKKIAILPTLSSSLDIVRIALEQNTNISETAKIYFTLGQRFHIDWLRQQARYKESSNNWDREATSGLIDQLFSCQAGLTSRIITDCKIYKEDGEAIDVWISKHPHILEQLDPFFEKLHKAGALDLPMLVIAEQRLRNIYGG